MLNLNSLAASPCVISFFLVFFNATSRSLSTWVISSCPSCIPKAWGCQDDISTLLKDDILILLPHQKLGTVWGDVTEAGIHPWRRDCRCLSTRGCYLHQRATIAGN